MKSFFFRHPELVEGSVQLVAVPHRRMVIERRYSRILLLSAVLLLSACSKLTEDNLQKIHSGMTTDEVKAILGAPNDWEGSGLNGTISQATYTYHTNASDVKITFVNDKVIATEGDFK